MYLTKEGRKIVEALRHGAMNPVELEQATGIPPFTLRATLKGLKRDRLVVEHLTTKLHEYELTVLGCGEAWSGQQLKLA